MSYGISIGENIKKLRKSKKLTQKQLSEKANISRSYLADVENNRYNPSLDVLFSISKALETTAQQLLKEDIDTKDEIDELEDDLKTILNKIKKVSPSNRQKILKMIEILDEEN